MKKRSLSLILSLALLLCAMPLTARAESSFTDVPAGAWYKPYIDKITQVQGIIDGYGDGTFRPDQNVTRGEFLKMILTAVQMAGSGLFTTGPGAITPWPWRTTC